MKTWLYVDRPVAALQMDLDTSGEIALLGVQKEIYAARTPAGLLRVLIYGGMSTFSGRFAEVTDAVAVIAGVIGANPDGSDAGAAVQALQQPEASIEIRLG